MVTKSLEEENARHREVTQKLYSQLSRLERFKRMALENVDLEKAALAEKVLYVKMEVTKLVGDDRSEVKAAIADLVKGGTTLRRAYFATKNYDGWYHQGSGPHEYGMGPRHGSVCFAVAMAPDRKKDPAPLSNTEIEACIYALELLLEGRYVPHSLYELERGANG
ncbi:MAG: hypothetical protein IT285_16105 [Bdellovibrionales bacterium]|nr:hypothetical protein [Bdellovibrionales bacterium]